MKCFSRATARFLVLMVLFSTVEASADPCDFIRQQLSHHPLTDSEIVIPAGTYICTKPLVMDRSHLHLRGEMLHGNIPEVFLKLADGANAPVIVMGDAKTPPQPLEDISVKNLSIDGNRLHQTLECWGGPCDSGGTSYVRNNGISVRGLTNGHIENVAITSARSGGVVTERGCYQLQIDRLTSTNNHFDGFAGYETTGSLISNSVLANNLAAGISLDIGFNGNTFRNVVLNSNHDVGVFMRDSSHNLFDSVRVLHSGNHGLFLAQERDSRTCPLENEFANLTVTGSSGFGFRLNDACPGNQLTGFADFAGNRDGCISEGSSVPLQIQGQILCEK